MECGDNVVTFMHMIIVVLPVDQYTVRQFGPTAAAAAAAVRSSVDRKSAEICSD